MTTNFLELATTLKYLGAKWLPEKKVNFTPCIQLYNLNKIHASHQFTDCYVSGKPFIYTLFQDDLPLKDHLLLWNAKPTSLKDKFVVKTPVVSSTENTSCISHLPPNLRMVPTFVCVHMFCKSYKSVHTLE